MKWAASDIVLCAALVAIGVLNVTLDTPSGWYAVAAGVVGLPVLAWLKSRSDPE